MSTIKIIFFAPGKEPEIIKIEDSISAWEELLGRPVGTYSTGLPNFGLVCLDTFIYSDLPNRVRASDRYLIKGPFIVHKTHQGVTVDVTEQDFARVREAFRPINTSEPTTLSKLLAAKAAEALIAGFATTPSADLQELLEKFTRPDYSVPADLTHARVAAAAVGLSAILDRYKGLVVFRLMRDDVLAPDYSRACGQVTCEICGYRYDEHPASISAPFLAVLCNGKHVKL